jgi:hypothetical protein
MSNTNPAGSSDDRPEGRVHEPTRKERLRPVELIVMSAILALFTGLITLLATREIILSSVGFGVAFIVALVVLAMLSLSFKPNAGEIEDIEEQDRGE